MSTRRPNAVGTARLATLLNTLVVGVLFSLSAVPLLPAQVRITEKDLYFLVIDQSRSIQDKGLLNPIRREISNFVQSVAAQAPQSEIRLKLFSDTAAPQKVWKDIGPDLRGFLTQFNKDFTPTGQTRLFDTVAEVFQVVQAEGRNYRCVRIMILSDGDDNKSRTYKTWRQLQPLAMALTQSHECLEVFYYSLLFRPREIPEPPIKWIDKATMEDGRIILPLAPSADFTANPRKALINQPVLFALRESAGIITNVIWRFGDGQTSTERSPVHTFSNEGLYSVGLEVFGPGGRIVRTNEGFIRVFAEPPLEAAFSWVPLRVHIGEPMKFINESTGHSTQWWSFNGSIRLETHPIVTFSTNGTVEVTLFVARDGQTTKMHRYIRVLPPPPDATFTVSTNRVEKGGQVRLIGNEPQGEHTWTIGGDLRFTGPEVIWTPDREGMIEILHIVTGPGGTSQKEGVIYVGANIPVYAAFQVSTHTVRVGETVWLMDQSKGEPIAWVWAVEGYGTFTNQHLSMTFTQIASVSIELRATRREKTDAITQVVQVDPALPPTNVPPVAAFAVSATGERVPLKVVFKNKTMGAATNFIWKFGDGTPDFVTAQGGDVEHTFTNAGQPRVELIAQGVPEHGQAFASVIIDVKPPLTWWQRNWKWALPAGCAALVALIGGTWAAWNLLLVPWWWKRKHRRLSGRLKFCKPSDGALPVYADRTIQERSGVWTGNIAKLAATLPGDGIPPTSSLRLRKALESRKRNIDYYYQVGENGTDRLLQPGRSIDLNSTDGINFTFLFNPN